MLLDKMQHFSKTKEIQLISLKKLIKNIST